MKRGLKRLGRPRVERVPIGELEAVVRSYGEGEPLVLIVSPLILARTYKPTIAALRERFTVHVIELPGCGRASRVPRGLSPDENADLLAKSLDGLALDRALVLGHSNSGPTAAVFALLHPLRVSELVLVDSIGAALDDNVTRVLIRRAVDGLINEPLLSLTVLPHALWNLFHHTASFLRQIPLAADSNLLHRLRELESPTLLAWGRRDWTIPRVALERFKESIPNATVTIGPGSHDWLITRPNTFAASLKAWLDDVRLHRTELSDAITREIERRHGELYDDVEGERRMLRRMGR
jgi:pimeloyl-ACP methyl ester carboxylesterase